MKKIGFSDGEIFILQIWVLVMDQNNAGKDRL